MTLEVSPAFLLAALAVAFGAGSCVEQHVVRAQVAADNPPMREHQVFYAGRPRVFVGDEATEVEVFQDQAGTWTACVFKHGRCWRGKLEMKSKG